MAIIVTVHGELMAVGRDVGTKREKESRLATAPPLGV
jgi:hypothetical protein